MRIFGLLLVLWSCSLGVTDHLFGIRQLYLQRKQLEQEVAQDRKEQESRKNDGTSAEIKWFSQKLDHSRHDDRSWNQKYWVNKRYYKEGGPMFVSIGGEGPTGRYWAEGEDGSEPDWLKNAKLFNAMCFVLEHRFYGESYPLDNSSVENLEYLSSRQALADLAYFIDETKRSYNLSDAKVITFGGSYAGALSAWFRLKYPHIVTGAVATSAPVQAKVDFKEYLEVVNAALSSYNCECPVKIGQATMAIQGLIGTTEGRAQLKQKLHLCDDLDIEDSKDVSNFYSSLAEVFMGAVQYNKDNRGIFADVYTIDNLCDKMVDSKIPDLIERYGNAIDFVQDAMNNNDECLDFKYNKMVKELKSETLTPGSASRLWIYQTCTEFGYYQTSESTNQPFGNGFPTNFWLDMCKDVFGEGFTPKSIFGAVAETNRYYGGKDLESSDIILLNGSIDPWHALSILNSTDPDLPAVYINGTAHCANMYAPRAEDPVGLTIAREDITNQIRKWLNE